VSTVMFNTSSSPSACAIRNPINGILGLCELLLETDLTAQQHHYVDSIAKHADFLFSIANNNHEGEFAHQTKPVHNPDLTALWEMLGNSESLMLRVLARYKAVLREDREYLLNKGNLLNKKELSKQIELMKGSASYSGYPDFAAYLAGLECAINNSKSTHIPNEKIIRELVEMIDNIIAFEPRLSLHFSTADPS
jgi:signal transduction histidine kinase